jgi:SAM-dependent methyltransferase
VTHTQVVDIDEGARPAAERSGHDFFCGRIEDVPTDQKFDLILMLNLIEHVADPVSVLQKSKGLLSPKGRIYVKTPNFRALDATIFRNMNWGGYHCPRHFVLFSKNSFDMLAQKAGLEIGSFSYTQGAPFWAISILEILRRFGIVRISRQRPSIYHPLTPLLQAAGAAFDFARKPFMRLSQMVIVLKQ